MNKLIIVFASILLAISCTKKLGPEETLREFIDYRFTSNQSAEKIMSFLDGDILEETQEMKDEELKQFLETEKFRKNSFKIIHANCNEDKCFLTYVLKYVETKEEEKSETEVKKIAELRKVDENTWKIFDITNVKTYIENKETIGDK